MERRTRVAVVAAAAGATVLLGVGLAVPAVAMARGVGPFAGCVGVRADADDSWGRAGSGTTGRGMGPGTTGRETGTGMGMGMGMGAGRGMGTDGRGMGTDGRGMGMGRTADRSDAGARPGSGTGPGTAYPSGELTTRQADGLVTMVQEETLAHDLYTALADRYDDPVLARIAASEARHVEAVRTLLDTYDLTDPTVGAAPGDLADPALAAMYDRLLTQGEGSLDAAYAVGRAVETDDLARLADAGAGVTAADVTHVYAQLTRASEQHLAAFGGDA